MILSDVAAELILKCKFVRQSNRILIALLSRQESGKVDISLQELSEITDMRKNRACESIQELTKMGLISRIKDPKYHESATYKINFDTFTEPYEKFHQVHVESTTSKAFGKDGKTNGKRTLRKCCKERSCGNEERKEGGDYRGGRKKKSFSLNGNISSKRSFKTYSFYKKHKKSYRRFSKKISDVTPKAELFEKASTANCRFRSPKSDNDTMTMPLFQETTLEPVNDAKNSQEGGKFDLQSIESQKMTVCTTEQSENDSSPVSASPESIPEKLADSLAKHILANNPKNRFLQSDTYEKSVKRWSRDIDLMMRKDNRTEDEIIQIIEWSQTISDFWYRQILSGKNLREHFDRMWLQMNDVRRKKYERKPVYDPQKSNSEIDSFLQSHENSDDIF